MLTRRERKLQRLNGFWLLIARGRGTIELVPYKYKEKSVHSIQELEEDAQNEQKENIFTDNIDEPVKSLSQLVGAFKTLSSRDIHKLEITKNIEKPMFKWHKSFHDRIIRDEK